MKNFKELLILSLLLVTSSVLRAQGLDSKAFTVQTYLGMYMEGEELMSYDVNEVYNVSLNDGYLVHNILKDNIVTDSQVYKMTGLKREQKESEGATFTFDATSGISGNVYTYAIFFDKEGGVTLTRIQPDGEVTIFMGTSAILKSYNQ